MAVKKTKTLLDTVRQYNLVDFYTQSEAINDFVINIILVATGARQACLLESANMEKPEWFDVFPKVKNLIGDLGLHTTHDPLSLKEHPRVFVSSEKIPAHSLMNSRDIGRLLGITYLRNDYKDFHKPRYGIHIKVSPLDVDVFSQVVVDLGNDNYKGSSKIRQMGGMCQKKWREHIPEFKDFRFQVSTTFDAGTDHRFQELRQGDDIYIMQNIGQYLNDMYNFSQEEIVPDDEHIRQKMIAVYTSLYNTKQT